MKSVVLDEEVKNGNQGQIVRPFRIADQLMAGIVGWKKIMQSEKGQFFLRKAHLILAWPLFCLLLAALLWSLMFAELDAEKRFLEADALRDVASLSKAYAGYLNRTIEQIDQLTLHLKYDWEKSHGAFRLEAPQRQGVFNFQHVAAITIIDRNGIPVTSSYGFDNKVSVKDRDYFKFHQANRSEQLRMGAPLAGRISGSVIIGLTRRLNDAQGEFDGVIIVAVAPEYFFSFANTAILDNDGFQAFVSKDQVVRVAKAGGVTHWRRNTLFSAIPTNPAPMLLSGSQWFVDGKSRYVASQPLNSYPFFAIVGISREAVLSYYAARRVTYYNAAIGISAVLFLFALIAMMLSARLAWNTRRLEAVRNTYRIATEGGHEGYYMWRAIRDSDMNLIDFEIVDCNERGAALFGIRKPVLLNTRLSSIDHIKPYLQTLMLHARIAMDTGFYEDDFKVPGNGVMAAEWLRERMVRSEEGLAVTLRDISEQKAHESELTHLANQDALTDLPNRHWLMNYLPKALEAATVRQTPLAVLFIDLDDFKIINDTLGHSVGDQLLQAVAVRLQSILRPEDNAARLGGDEFTFVLESVVRQNDIASIAERIVQAFHQPFEIHQRQIAISASIGISVFPRDGNDAETLIKNADIAMYSAKAQGRDGFQFYDEELSEQIKRSRDAEQELLRALHEDHFVMYYQARVDAISGKLVGMEALVRWLHPEHGLISPDAFIPLAETTGMILPLGELVMEKVCAQLAAWQRRGLPVVPVSVNVSARQFDEGRVSQCIAACMAKHGIDARLLEIELTESAMMGNFEKVYKEIEAINAQGIQMHVDDFGTGYSSLSLLYKFNMDVLKVDRAFTSQLANGKGGEIFFAAIVSMAKALGMRVVAEGVETEQQLSILQDLQCDEIQGYLVAKPLHANEIPALMQKRYLLPEPELLLSST